MSTFAEGYLEGLLVTTWHCHDCGNRYQADIEGCPNTLLDEAHACVRSLHWRRDNGIDDEQA